MKLAPLELLQDWPGARLYRWMLTAEQPDGAPACEPDVRRQDVMLLGSLAGGRVVLEGSLMLTDPRYLPLRNPDGLTLAFTSPGHCHPIREQCCLVRPRLLDAAPEDRVEVYLLCVKR